MLTADAVARSPAVFPSLFGVTAAEFEALFADYLAARDRLRVASRTTRRGTPRVRAVGGGDTPKLDDRTQVMRALFWLRIYPTYQVLGFFCALPTTNARLTARAVLAVLRTLDEFPFDDPDPTTRAPTGTPDAVMAAFPDVRRVIDGKEQRTQRPTGHAAQKADDSGTKKAHTLKSQLAVTPGGRIESVSGSFPGSTHDPTVLRATAVIDRLPAGAGAMMDKGYVGIGKDHPDRPLVVPAKAARGRPLTDEQRAANRVISSHRIAVEHVMAQLNRFQVLTQTYRHARPEHGEVVRAVAVLVNRRTAVTPLKTYPPAP
jgi:DDE superfamily endonuclease